MDYKNNDMDFGLNFWTLEESDSTRESSRTTLIRFGTSGVPVMISVRHGHKLLLTDFADAQAVYIAQRDSVSPGVRQTVCDVNGTAVDCIVVDNGQFSVLYAVVDQPITTANTVIAARMSRSFTGLFGSISWFGSPGLDQIFRAPESRGKGARLTIEQASWLPLSKVTAQHHVHFKVDEIMAALDEEDRAWVTEHVRIPEDATQSFAAGLILWAALTRKEFGEGLLAAGVFSAGTAAEFAKIGKRISVEAKSLQNLVEKDLRPIFELDVLVNRGFGKVDWVAEKSHRMKPKTAHFTYDEILTKAKSVFSDAAGQGKRPRKLNWDEFWKTRWQWSAAGSTHSQYPDDMALVEKTDIRLKNKFITISKMGPQEFGDFAGRQPSIHAWSSYKYEWGKERAIYGTDLTSYILSHFAFYNCEDVLPRQFPVGKAANDRNVASKVAGILSGNQPLCIDFEDFNSQHSADHMAAVVRAYLEVFGSMVDEDQRIAMEWTARSVYDMTVHDNSGTKTLYKANGTLLSGWRLTTFINSVLNFIYTSSILAEKRVPGSSVHNGDDVLVGCNNLVVAQKAVAGAREKGVRLQASKCAFSGIAEFLRIDHVRGSKGQYLARAIATLVHSRIESKMSTDARDLISAMESRFDDLWHRGCDLDMIAKLRDIYYTHQSKVCDMPKENFYTIKRQHAVVGGICKDITGELDYVVEPGLRRADEVELPNMPAIAEYASVVRKALQMDVPYEKLVSRLTHATREAVMEKSRSMKLVLNSDPWYKRVKPLYKVHKGDISVAAFGKAALVGLAFDALMASDNNPALRAVLNMSQRPLDLLDKLI